MTGYDGLTRANRLIVTRLDAFAYELPTFVSMGLPLNSPDPSAVSTVRPLSVRPAVA